MEVGYIDSLVKKFCELSRQCKDLKNEKNCKAWLAYETDFFAWRKVATPEEKAYYDRFIDPENLHMICSGIRYMKENKR